MARNQETITVAHKEVRELTNADASRITFAVLEGQIEIRIETSATATGDRGLPYSQGSGEIQRPLSELVEAGGVRVIAIGKAFPNSAVLVDHA